MLLEAAGQTPKCENRRAVGNSLFRVWIWAQFIVFVEISQAPSCAQMCAGAVSPLRHRDLKITLKLGGSGGD